MIPIPGREAAVDAQGGGAVVREGVEAEDGRGRRSVTAVQWPAGARPA